MNILVNKNMGGWFLLFFGVLFLSSLINLESMRISWIFSMILSLTIFFYLFYTKGENNLKILVVTILFFYSNLTYIDQLILLPLKDVAGHLGSIITALILFFSFKIKKKFYSLSILLFAIYVNLLFQQKILIAALIIAIFLQVFNKKTIKYFFYALPVLGIPFVIFIGFYFFNHRLFNLRDVFWLMHLVGDINTLVDPYILEIKLKTFQKNSLDEIDYYINFHPHSMFIGSFQRFHYLGLLMSFIFWSIYSQIMIERILNISKFQRNLLVAFITMIAIFQGRSFFSVDNYTINIFIISYIFLIGFGVSKNQK